MSSYWDEMALKEEEDRDDEAINRALRWREIERHLGGVTTVLDVGAGTGAFSLPLAERGFQVTHFDHSAPMIARARARTTAAVDFVQGSAADLGGRCADLVLNMDGAISFAGASGARAVIAASCAAAKRTLIVTVSNKAAMAATWVKYSLKADRRLLPAVHEMMRTGSWDKDQFAENALIFPDVCKLPALKAFAPDELRTELEACGMNVVTVRAIGSLTHLLLPHADVAAPADVAGFLDLCEQYDREVLPGGPGSFRRAGLLAVATPRLVSRLGDAVRASES